MVITIGESKRIGIGVINELIAGLTGFELWYSGSNGN